jgi:hypothetical protein
VISDFIEKRQTRKSRQSLTAKDAARENARLWDRLYVNCTDHYYNDTPEYAKLIFILLQYGV